MKHNAVEGPQYKAVANKQTPPERARTRNIGTPNGIFDKQIDF